MDADGVHVASSLDFNIFGGTFLRIRGRRVGASRSKSNATQVETNFHRVLQWT